MKFNDQKKLYRQNALTQSDILYLPDSRGLDVTVVSGSVLISYAAYMAR